MNSHWHDPIHGERLNMKLQSLLAIIALGMSLSSCAGMDAAMQYSDVHVQDLQANGHPWRIFDKPTEGRLMITRSLGRAMGGGFLAGLSFGAADTEIPKPEYQSAVQVWLDTKHSTACVVTDGYKLIKPQWEFKYRCP
jgi:hypothetical protein